MWRGEAAGLNKDAYIVGQRTRAGGGYMSLLQRPGRIAGSLRVGQLIEKNQTIIQRPCLIGVTRRKWFMQTIGHEGSLCRAIRRYIICPNP